MSQYPAILTTDLHLTSDRLDGYRFDVFDRIEELRRKYSAKTLLVLGDVTDAKDNHPAKLNCAIAHSFAKCGMRTIINQGNHDYLQKEWPYLEYLNLIEGLTFITRPTRIGDWLFIPHSRTLPLPGLHLVDPTLTHVFLHQTVTGAMASNGQIMEGEIASTGLPHAATVKYYSGDIHVPQRCGDVEYVGSPYPVHFGDTYKPRILVLNSPRVCIEEHYVGPRRLSVRIGSAGELSSFGLKQGDQCKVMLVLSRQDMPDWQECKRAVQKWCDVAGVTLRDLRLEAPKQRRQLVEPGAVRTNVASPDTVLSRYAAARGITRDAVDVGREHL